MSLIEEIYNECNNAYYFKDLISKLREEKNLVVWGTGVAGQMIYSSLKKLNINVQNFTDNSVQMNESRLFHGIPVIHPERVDKCSTVIIAASYFYSIHKRVEELRIKEYVYIDPFYILGYKDGFEDSILAIYDKNKDKIEQVYNSLMDDISRRVYKNVLIHRVIHNMNLLWDIYEKNQYFGNDVVPHAEGCFVDCGAYNGDTLESFLKQIGTGDYHYYALEPEQENYNKLLEFAEGIGENKIDIYMLGAWDTKTTMSFSTDEVKGQETGCIVEGVTSDYSIEVDSVDNILGDHRADFIKMDIEGAELHALEGCKKTINKYKPILAISAYHELDHLWRVPLKILSICPDYKLYFRHHMWNMVDTVCYGLIQG